MVSFINITSQKVYLPSSWKDKVLPIKIHQHWGMFHGAHQEKLPK